MKLIYYVLLIFALLMVVGISGCVSTQSADRSITGDWYCTNDGYYDKYLHISSDKTATYKTVGKKGEVQRESKIQWKKKSSSEYFLWGFSQPGYYRLSSDGTKLTYGSEDGKQIFRTYVKQ